MQTPYEPCGMCHDTGKALYIQDAKDNALYGPLLNSLRAEDKIIELCAENELDRRAGAFRFYQAIGDCTCKRQPRYTSGEQSQIDKLRNMFKKPSGAQFEGLGWTSYERLDDPDKAKAFRAAQFFASNNESKGRAGLLLTGACGVGKTGLMYLIYKSREADGAVWCDYNEMLALIQSTYNTRGNDTLQIIQALEFVPVLLIDDMGDAARSQALTDDKRDKTYDVLRVRHERKLLTVITTNLDHKGMKYQFGQRIYSRLRELCVWVTVGGRDLRIKDGEA